MELSKISEEMAHTEDYFKIAIELELKKLITIITLMRKKY